VKNYNKFLFSISNLMLCVGMAHADGKECDSAKHSQAKVSYQGIMFKSVDTNGDGAISKSEFNDYYEKHNNKHFTELDANKDSKITPDELQGSHRQGMAQHDGTSHLRKRFSAADANHDGGLDKSEASAMPMLTTYFVQVDSNHDGKVTQQEYFDAMPLLHGAKQIDSGGKSQAL